MAYPSSPLIGYADRLSARPGGTINFHVSSGQSAPAIAANIVHVICGDPTLGIQTEPVKALHQTLECVEAPRPQATRRGSYAAISLPPHTVVGKQITLELYIMPWLEGGEKPQVIACLPGILELQFSPSRHLTCFCHDNNPVQCSDAIPIRHWTKVWCRWTPGSIVVGWQEVPSSSPLMIPATRQAKARHETQAVSSSPPPDSFSKEVLLYFAARPQGRSCDGDSHSHDSRSIAMEAHFNGRLEQPQLFFNKVLAGSWDFSQDMSSQCIVDVSGNGHDGRLHNRPTRAVRGSCWTGQEMCWRYAPQEYAAIHFHETDLGDAQWPVSYRYTIPLTLQSGCYAVMLRYGKVTEVSSIGNGQRGDNIPFFVVPPKGQPQAEVVVIIPTFTYIIYGNHARSEWDANPEFQEAWKGQTQRLGGYPNHPSEHPEFGLSTYNTHADGSGVCLCSWKRPMLNLKLGYITFPYPEQHASGLRHFPADTHLLAWLRRQNVNFDVVTDWELHAEGYEVLQPYRVAMTGSHPEYHSMESLNAIQHYRESGGRIMYLGGNGFYWKIAVDTEEEGVLEIRRGEGGVRAWASDPGEYYHQLDGSYGGLWRRNGRPPQSLIGLGFTAQGNFIGSYYRIRSNAFQNPRTSWIFEGVPTESGNIIGNHGLSGHGAAGYELDRADPSLGTPEHAIILASSEGHNPSTPWVLAFEERLTHLGNLVGIPDEDLVRSDLLFFETDSGGAVFSAGSITYISALLSPRSEDISQLTKNVLLRFLDAERVFQVP